VTTSDRTECTAALGLITALLAALGALCQGLPPLPAAQTAGLAYAGTLAVSASALHVPVPAVVVLSAKTVGVTLAASVLVTCSGAYSGWQLLRNVRTREATW
jgi:hypothetical protein